MPFLNARLTLNMDVGEFWPESVSVFSVNGIPENEDHNISGERRN